MKKLYLLTGFLIFQLSLFAQINAKSEEANEVLKVNEMFDQAWVKQDTVTLKRILSDDYSGITAEGYAWNKNAAVKPVPGLKFDFGSSVEVTLRMYGNAAVVTGRWIAAGTYKEKPFKDNELYTAVLVKRNGQWQIVANQQTAIREAKH